MALIEPRGIPPAIHPPIEPYESDYLDVGDQHQLYYERCGQPGGVAAIFLHGGPGGMALPDYRRLFDPGIYDVLLFDQRGCGRSRPRGRLIANTTWDLVADIERLRLLVGVDRWIVCGGSWGATLALAYAQSHPDRVAALILRAVFTLRQAELDWLYQSGASAFYPEDWQAFVDMVPLAGRHDVVGAYHALVSSADMSVHQRAACAWARWEQRLMTLIPGTAAAVSDDAAALLAQLELHYFAHRGWLDEGQLLARASQIRDIPGTIVQGRYDLICPPTTAFELHKRWPRARLCIVEGAGHSTFEPAILDRLLEATAFHARAGGAPRGAWA